MPIDGNASLKKYCGGGFCRYAHGIVSKKPVAAQSLPGGSGSWQIPSVRFDFENQARKLDESMGSPKRFQLNVQYKAFQGADTRGVRAAERRPHNWIRMVHSFMVIST